MVSFKICDISRYSQCLYIKADKEEKNEDQAQELSPVDSLMANHLMECIMCAILALSPVD